MPEKFKDFSKLTLRQKKKRAAEIWEKSFKTKVRREESLNPEEKETSSPNVESVSVASVSNNLQIEADKEYLPIPEATEIQIAEHDEKLFLKQFHDSDLNDKLYHEMLPADTLKNTDPLICSTDVLNLLNIIKEQNTLIMSEQQKLRSDVMAELTNMRTEIKQLKDELYDYNTDDSNKAETLYQPLKGFPLRTMLQFQTMESDEMKERRKELFHHLLSLGGTTPRHFLSNALREIMTDELVSYFTWRGDKHNTQFSSAKITNILYEAAKACPLFKGPDTKLEFKNEMTEIFRTTKQRHRNHTKKNMEASTIKLEIPDDYSIEESNF